VTSLNSLTPKTPSLGTRIWDLFPIEVTADFEFKYQTFRYRGNRRRSGTNMNDTFNLTDPEKPSSTRMKNLGIFSQPIRRLRGLDMFFLVTAVLFYC